MASVEEIRSATSRRERHFPTLKRRRRTCEVRNRSGYKPRRVHASPVTHPYWPLFDIVIRTPHLELRYPDDELLMELAAVAADGVHHPDAMPFLAPWTRAQPPELQRNAFQFWWGQRSSWTPENWNFMTAVLVDGDVVGVQDIGSRDFAVTRSVNTGSWLGERYQGRGIGTEMRLAILQLAFAGLGAELANSGAFEDNPASLRVSTKLGYERNGFRVHNREGKAVREVAFAMTRERWEPHRRTDIEIEGLDSYLDWFGASS